MENNDAPIIGGLVSMPWMAPTMPSIQLATPAAVLGRNGIASGRHELYLDYAVAIGVKLYRRISSQLDSIGDWIFAQDYFGRKCGNRLTSLRLHRPRLGLRTRELRGPSDRCYATSD